MRTKEKSEPKSAAPRPEALLPELAGIATSAEGYRLALKALADGRLSLRDADILTKILERGLSIHDAEVFEARIRAAETKALEAARLAGAARALPASQTVIEVPRDH